ncbi:hypothetical protein [Candidatus Viadribacter manganicus]|uniref:Uncharacterized protein n=1 Tax=Candidatus Viadribacter manganicus TaxID=1759059 RepID=A0A1B1AEC2_9PROT|nr:hypothetical protein [Candidatus Viadribacter manganicus]ANP44910.1 hypothetical protein ATE48_02710 [Candidatus Viadribacter manganicus]
MSKAPPPPRSGVTGLLWVFCATALLIGLGFDLGAGARVKFWIGDQPGSAAAVGATAVLFVLLATQAARFALGRRRKFEEEHADDPHA